MLGAVPYRDRRRAGVVTCSLWCTGWLPPHRFAAGELCLSGVERGSRTSAAGLAARHSKASLAPVEPKAGAKVVSVRRGCPGVTAMDQHQPASPGPWRCRRARPPLVRYACQRWWGRVSPAPRVARVPQGTLVEWSRSARWASAGRPRHVASDGRESPAPLGSAKRSVATRDARSGAVVDWSRPAP